MLTREKAAQSQAATHQEQTANPSVWWGGGKGVDCFCQGCRLGVAAAACREWCRPFLTRGGLSWEGWRLETDHTGTLHQLTSTQHPHACPPTHPHTHTGPPVACGRVCCAPDSSPDAGPCAHPQLHQQRHATSAGRQRAPDAGVCGCGCFFGGGEGRWGRDRCVVVSFCVANGWSRDWRVRLQQRVDPSGHRRQVQQVRCTPLTVQGWSYESRQCPPPAWQ